MSLFGSVLRGDFDPQHSDVDVLAEFEPGALRGVGFRYFGYGEQLSEILGRKGGLLFTAQPLHRKRRAAGGRADL